MHLNSRFTRRDLLKYLGLMGASMIVDIMFSKGYKARVGAITKAHEVRGRQTLKSGEIEMEKEEEMGTLFFLSGKRMYEIGAMSGDYPQIGWHIPDQMGGVWAHPIKVMDGFYFEIEDNDGVIWPLTDCHDFSHAFAYTDFKFERDELEVERRDFVVEDEPALFSLISLKNEGEEKEIKLRFSGHVHIMPSWFSLLPDGSDELIYDRGRIVGYDSRMRDKWAVVFGGVILPDDHKIEGNIGLLEYPIRLGEGEEVELSFLIVAEHQEGYKAALERFDRLIARGRELFEEKTKYYNGKIFNGVKFDCSDPSFVAAYYCAKANLVMLSADISPYIGRYLFAGIPEYVQLFGCDTAYSIPGVVSVGFSDIAKSALECLAEVGRRQGGEISHEVSTSGRVYNPGNIQETPQFVMACWDYFKWTGDRAFLEKIYPLCKEGIFGYVLEFCDVDKDYYPEGSAMVERPGMGPEKVDSACYLYKAILLMSGMAEALDKEGEAAEYKGLAEDIKVRFNRDWWIEEESLFADSLLGDNSPKLDGHWTVAVPMETGIADHEKGLRALERIEREWVNERGMVHTKDVDNRVWTLPTGVLAMAEFDYGNAKMGTRLLKNIAQTIEYGMLGAYEELIPQGGCFMQLWSSAIFLKGIMEGVLGLEPLAHQDSIGLSPKLPEGWEFVKAEGLRMGEHQVDISLGRADRNEFKVVIRHPVGERDLRCSLSIFREEPSIKGGILVSIVRTDDILKVDLIIKPGQEVELTGIS